MNKTLFRSLVEVWEKIDLRLLIALVWMVSYWGFYIGPNGEQYLNYAKLYALPEWFPHSIWFKDFPGTRLLFQSLFGWMFQFIPTEWVAFIGRSLLIVLLSFPLARLFKCFQVSHLLAVGILLIIYLPNQAWYGSGYIFQGGFETKVFAYFFALYGLVFLFEGQFVKGWVCLAISTWFHILVGGWLAVIAGIWMLIQRHPIKTLLLNGGIYAVLVAPLIGYMYIGLLGQEAPMEAEVNLDWVYTYFRNPHHTTPFHKGFDFFRRKFLGGTVYALILTLAVVFLFPKYSSDKRLRSLNHFLIALLIHQGFAFLIAALDTNGSFLKLYPFRPAVFLHLLAWLAVIRFFQRTLQEGKWGKVRTYIPQASLILALAIILNFGSKLAFRMIPNFGPIYDPEYLELVEFVKENSSPQDLFISLDQEVPESFMRMTLRNQWVIWKAVPSEKAMLYEWYQRVKEREKVFEDPNYLKTLVQKHDISFAIGRKHQDKLEFPLIFQNESFYVYQIEKR